MAEKRKRRSKKLRARSVVEIPVRRSRTPQDDRLSEIMREMALRLLKDPAVIPSAPAAQAALTVNN